MWLYPKSVAAGWHLLRACLCAQDLPRLHHEKKWKSRMAKARAAGPAQAGDYIDNAAHRASMSCLNFGTHAGDYINNAVHWASRCCLISRLASCLQQQKWFLPYCAVPFRLVSARIGASRITVHVCAYCVQAVIIKEKTQCSATFVALLAAYVPILSALLHVVILVGGLNCLGLRGGLFAVVGGVISGFIVYGSIQQGWATECVSDSCEHQHYLLHFLLFFDVSLTVLGSKEGISNSE